MLEYGLPAVLLAVVCVSGFALLDRWANQGFSILKGFGRNLLVSY
jgi:hypothetical protein